MLAQVEAVGWASAHADPSVPPQIRRVRWQPGGRKTIAHRFNGGYQGLQTSQVPSGTKECPEPGMAFLSPRRGSAETGPGFPPLKRWARFDRPSGTGGDGMVSIRAKRTQFHEPGWSFEDEGRIVQNEPNSRRGRAGRSPRGGGRGANAQNEANPPGLARWPSFAPRPSGLAPPPRRIVQNESNFGRCGRREPQYSSIPSFHRSNPILIVRNKANFRPYGNGRGQRAIVQNEANFDRSIVGR